jgi:hypothetical protein
MKTFGHRLGPVGGVEDGRSGLLQDAATDTASMTGLTT